MGVVSAKGTLTAEPSCTVFLGMRVRLRGEEGEEEAKSENYCLPLSVCPPPSLGRAHTQEREGEKDSWSLL